MRHVAWVALCALVGLSACGGDGAEGGETRAVSEPSITDDIGPVGPEAKRPLRPGEMASSCRFPSDCNSGIRLGSKFHKDFAAGYCTKFCDPARFLSCGIRRRCIDAGVHICVRDCTADNDCYSGQRCAGRMCVPERSMMDPASSNLLNDDSETLKRIRNAVSMGELYKNVAMLIGKPRIVLGPGQILLPVDDGLANVDALQGAINIHLDTIISSRSVGHPDHDLARTWLVAKLLALKLEVQEQEFRGMQGSDAMFPHKITNVRAILRGSSPLLSRVVVMAHYDSRASGIHDYDPMTDPAPGAGANAVGVRAVLEIARVLSTEVGQLRRTVEFLFVDAGEQGWSGQPFDAHAGATAYVRSIGQATPFCTLNLDGLAWKSTVDPYHTWIGLDPDYLFASQLAIEAVRDQLPDFQAVTTTNDAFFERSDQRPFTAHGLCAAEVYSYPPSARAHTALDTPDAIDWTKFKGAARAAALVVGAWADFHIFALPWAE